jgi:hypothetical protein
MNNTPQSLDKLYESLTLTPKFEKVHWVPYGGYGTTHKSNSNFWYGGWTTSETVSYRNELGQLHRLYGPAHVNIDYDVEMWKKAGEFHRTDGPALRQRMNQFWYEDGVLHRIDGPAVVHLGGPKQYWIRGVKYSPKEYKKEISRRRRKGLIE